MTFPQVTYQLERKRNQLSHMQAQSGILSKQVFPTKHYLARERTLIVAGGFQGEIQDTAWFVTGNNKPQPNPIYTSNAEKSDTRIWLHVQRSEAQTILVMSPDADVSNIGLTHTQQKSTCTENPLQF